MHSAAEAAARDHQPPEIMAKLDISETASAGPGRIKIKINIQGKQKEVDYRVSVLPTLSARRS